MYIKMIGLYGFEDQKAWFRKRGDCFDFVTRKEFASDLTAEEAAQVMKYRKWYCDQYQAELLIIEKNSLMKKQL